MTAPADELEDDEIWEWSVTAHDGTVRTYPFEPDDIASIELPDRNLFAPDFASLIAFAMASAPDHRVWS